jgi:cyclopropane fatty-acyl-phospholipid synthase-like methyltransferase
VDISEVDIRLAQTRMPDIKDNFLVIPPKPATGDRFFGGQFDAVISIQTLYFLSDTDLQVRLKSLYEMMKPGALIYVSMMGTQSYFSKYATPAEDGLSRIDFANDRIAYKDFYVNLTRNEQDLEEKFSLFKKVYIGYYDRNYRNEGSEFHYTFTGQKV